MSEYIIKYPLDLTGVAPENRIEGEPHVLQPGLNRSLVPRYGAFFTDGLVVRDADTTEILVANDQYIPIMYHAEASERAGKEICAAIIILDGTVSDNVIVDYQVVGDIYQNLSQVITDLIDNLNLDEREVMWGDLLGRPDAFPPAHHLHDLGDIFGFEYLVAGINDLRDAVLYGDVASHDELKAMIEARRAELQQNIDILRGEYEEHRDRVDNPHTVTKAQVGLGSVANHPLATRAEAEAGLLTTRYMTPLRTAEAIQVFAIDPLDTHKADYTNPHNVTKAQVGLGVVENMPRSTQVEAEEGLLNTSYMTPVRVKQAIDIQAIVPLTAHVDRSDNPHNVTAVQVGLGLVSNYPTATQIEAEAGTANNRFMTPARVAQAITEQAGTLLQSHVNDTTNPHQVTKAQVGLSNVPNWIPATAAQVTTISTDENAALPNSFLTPVLARRLIDEMFRSSGEALEGILWYRGTEGRTAGAFDSLAAAPAGTVDLNYNGHFNAVRFSGNGRDLTGMVKSQVGLTNVDNYLTATTAEATAGTANNRFMTPLRVAQAITQQAGTLLQSHVDDKTNPHQVTKAQVGLGNVENLTLANQAEAQSGTLNTRYMTPLRVAQAITQQAGTLLQAHIDDNTNPHSVTKAQVGLGAVDNFSTATQLEAEAGTVNNRFTTPLRVQQYVTGQRRDAASGNVPGVLAYQGHTREAGTFYGGTVNPSNLVRMNLDAALHATSFVGNGAGLTGMSKTQVGLNNIPNSITASRTTNSNATLLTAKGMFDHIAADDHGATYLRKAGQDTGFTLGKNAAGLSRITFSAQIGGNDPGIIEHYNEGDVARMRFSVSDNWGQAADHFDFGAITSNGWASFFKIDGTGKLTGNGAGLSNIVKSNVAEELSFRTSLGTLQCYISGAWRQVWPPQWQ